MLSRVVMRRNSREPVRTSGLLQTWLGCGRSFAVMTASVSHTAFTNAFIVSIGRCSPMPWITTTACMSAWVAPADAGCAAWGEPESLIGVQTSAVSTLADLTEDRRNDVAAKEPLSCICELSGAVEPECQWVARTKRSDQERGVFYCAPNATTVRRDIVGDHAFAERTTMRLM